MKLLNVSLVFAAMLMAGCQPQQREPEPCKIVEPLVKERNEVIARRGALEVKLAGLRGEYARNCIERNNLPVAFESDRPSLCRKNAAELYPDTITAQLLSEFNGDLTESVTQTQAQ